MIVYLEEKIEDAFVEFNTVERLPNHAVPTGRVIASFTEYLIGTKEHVKNMLEKINESTN